MRRSIFMLAVLLAATGTAAFAGEYYNKDKQNPKRGEPTEDKALVYVFRPATVGSAIRTWAFADEQFLGVSKSKAYFFALVPEGKHVFWAKAENTSGVEIEVEGGKTYYFKTAIQLGPHAEPHVGGAYHSHNVKRYKISVSSPSS